MRNGSEGPACGSLGGLMGTKRKGVRDGQGGGVGFPIMYERGIASRCWVCQTVRRFLLLSISSRTGGCL